MWEASAFHLIGHYDSSWRGTRDMLLGQVHAVVESDGSSDMLRVDLRRVPYDLSAYRNAASEVFVSMDAVFM